MKTLKAWGHAAGERPSANRSPSQVLAWDSGDGDVPSIALRGVSKKYGKTTALLPLDLDVREGEVFCLLGPSGCGKSTTLNIIGGFLTPSSGSVQIRGEHVEHVPAHQRDVNTVFQSYGLFPHMTVTQNISFGLRMRKTSSTEIAARVGQVIELVGLGDKAAVFPAQLSGGQRQRVAVARALINRPAVLLLDEPLGALDLNLRKRLQLELLEIQQQIKTTFVMVTHDQSEAMMMADRIAVMNEGRIEQLGTPTEIYCRPANKFVASFVGESNFIEVAKDAENQLRDQRLRALLPDDAHQPWANATIMVRPENVRLAVLDEREDPTVLDGVVVQISFLGTSTQTVVELGDGSLIVSSHPGGLETAPRPGERVSVSAKPDDVVVLEPTA